MDFEVSSSTAASSGEGGVSTRARTGGVTKKSVIRKGRKGNAATATLGRKEKAAKLREAKKKEAMKLKEEKKTLREAKKLETAKRLEAKKKEAAERRAKKREEAQLRDKMKMYSSQRREAFKAMSDEYYESCRNGKWPDPRKDFQTERIGKEFPNKKAEEVVLQLNVSLCLGRKPSPTRPWRRILIPATVTFKQLHRVIQRAFGWNNSHLYEFRIGIEDNRRNPESCIYIPTHIRGKTQMDEGVYAYLWKEGDVALYTYDFGVGWDHSIVVEKVLERKEGEKYPQLLAGKLRCPPEDPPYDPTTASGYPNYDPNDFNLSQISFKGLFDL